MGSIPIAYSISHVIQLPLCGRVAEYTPRNGRFWTLDGRRRPRLTLGTEPCAKVGSLQSNTVPSRIQFDLSAVRNFLLFGYLLDRQGERLGEWSPSCAVHLSSLKIGIDAHG